MMKFLRIFQLLILLSLPVFAQVPIGPRVQASGAYANRPTSPDAGTVYVITNASAAGAIDGAGSALTQARWNGSAWVALGDGGGSGSGTVTVVSSGALCSTCLVTGGGTTTLQTPSSTATVDASGNISTPGSISGGVGGTNAGAVALGQGTLPTFGAGAGQIPTSGYTGWSGSVSGVTTSYLAQLPVAQPAANQVLLFPSPTSSLAQATWVSSTTTVNGQACALGSTCTVADSTKVPTTTTVNGHALSGNVTVTASDVSLGSVTNDVQTKAAIVPNTAPAAGEVLIGNAGGTAYAKNAISGDFTIGSTGVGAIGVAKVTPAMQTAAGNTRVALWNVAAPATSDDAIYTVLNTATAVHLTRVSCGVTGSTSVIVNLVKGGNSLISDMTATAGTVNQVVVTTWANGSSQCGGTGSCAVAAHTPVTLHVGTITGTPTNLACAVDYTVD